jgi:hypothetical protein
MAPAWLCDSEHQASICVTSNFELLLESGLVAENSGAGVRAGPAWRSVCKRIHITLERGSGAACAHAAGVDPVLSMRTGDWASMQYLDYIWRSPGASMLWRANGSLGHLRLDAMQR